MSISFRQFEELQRTLCAIQEGMSNLETLVESANNKPLTEKEVVEMLSVSSKTLRNYRNEGIIGYSQIGKKFFYRMKDIQKMLDESYVEPLNFQDYDIN